MLFILFISTTSCKHAISDKVSTQELTGKEQKSKRDLIAFDELFNDNEKIVLLSETRKISFDTLQQILKDYYSETADYFYSRDSLRFFCEKAISSISSKFHITKSKASSLIFSYKYGMLSKQDIEEAAIDNYQDNLNEQAEPAEAADPLP